MKYMVNNALLRTPHKVRRPENADVRRYIYRKEAQYV